MKGSNVGKNKVEANSKSSAINKGDAVSVDTVGVTVVTANANRKAVMLFNDSDQIIYVFYGTSPEVNKGGRLNASGGYIREETYKGIITAIHGGTGNKVLTFIVI